MRPPTALTPLGYLVLLDSVFIECSCSLSPVVFGTVVTVHTREYVHSCSVFGLGFRDPPRARSSQASADSAAKRPQRSGAQRGPGEEN